MADSLISVSCSLPRPGIGAIVPVPSDRPSPIRWKASQRSGVSMSSFSCMRVADRQHLVAATTELKSTRFRLPEARTDPAKIAHRAANRDCLISVGGIPASDGETLGNRAAVRTGTTRRASTARRAEKAGDSPRNQELTGVPIPRPAPVPPWQTSNGASSPRRELPGRKGLGAAAACVEAVGRSPDSP